MPRTRRLEEESLGPEHISQDSSVPVDEIVGCGHLNKDLQSTVHLIWTAHCCLSRKCLQSPNVSLHVPKYGYTCP